MSQIIALISVMAIFEGSLSAQEIPSAQAEQILAEGELVTTGEIDPDAAGDKGGEIGFPEHAFPDTVDPLSGTKYEKVLVGPAQRLKWNEYSFGRITFYRYVTVYNSKRGPDFLMPTHPAIQEECHDESWSFGEWSTEYVYSVTLTIGGDIEAESLGLSASVSYAINNSAGFRTTRRLQGSRGIRALHTPYGSTEDWEGRTYIQWYNRKNGKYGYLKKGLQDYLVGLFEDFGTNPYPWYFYLNNQNFVFKVKRTNVEVCPGYEGKVGNRPDKKSDIEVVLN